jgi:hypothetical protein
MRVIIFVLCGTVLLYPSVDGQARPRKEVRLRVDGKLLMTRPSPVIRRGRVFIPVLAFQRIGLVAFRHSDRYIEIGWPQSDRTIGFKAGVGTYRGEGPDPNTIPLPGTPFMRGRVLMVPLRSMLSDTDEGTSLIAQWNATTRTVHVHRSKGWLRWRLQNNGGPDCLFTYTTPI